MLGLLSSRWKRLAFVAAITSIGVLMGFFKPGLSDGGTIGFNISAFLQILPPFLLLMHIGYMIFSMIIKRQESLSATIVSSFGLGGMLNYLLMIVLSQLFSLDRTSLASIYLSIAILLSILVPIPKTSFILKRDILAAAAVAIIPLMLFQAMQQSYLWVDMIPYVSSAQQIASFGRYDPLDNNPSPIYSHHQVLPFISTYFAYLSILTGMKAFVANSAFLIIQGILLLAGTSLLASALFDEKSRKWSILLVMSSYVWQRSMEVRGTTISFIFLSSAIALIILSGKIERYRIIGSVLLALSFMANPTIGIIGFVCLAMVASVYFLKGSSIIRPGHIISALAMSFVLSSIYIYSNTRSIVTAPGMAVMALLALLIAYISTRLGEIPKRWEWIDALVFLGTAYYALAILNIFNLMSIRFFPMLFALSSISILSIVLAKTRKGIISLCLLVSPLLIYSTAHFIEILMPFFQTGNFTSKSDVFGLTFLWAIVASYLFSKLEDLDKESVRASSGIRQIAPYIKTASVVVIVFLFSLPVHWYQAGYEIREYNIVESWHRWMTSPKDNELRVRIPDSDQIKVIENVDSLIASGKIGMDESVLNHLVPLQVSVWTGANEILAIRGSTIIYGDDTVTRFRKWAFLNEKDTRLFSYPYKGDMSRVRLIITDRETDGYDGFRQSYRQGSYSILIKDQSGIMTT